MKHTKTCPKCGSHDILPIEKPNGVYADYNYIIAGFLSKVNVHRYLCCGCGYVENWVDQNDIPTLKSIFG